MPSLHSCLDATSLMLCKQTVELVKYAAGTLGALEMMCTRQNIRHGLCALQGLTCQAEGTLGAWFDEHKPNNTTCGACALQG